jgi:hypothetical protein
VQLDRGLCGGLASGELTTPPDVGVGSDGNDGVLQVARAGGAIDERNVDTARGLVTGLEALAQVVDLGNGDVGNYAMVSISF